MKSRFVIEIIKNIGLLFFSVGFALFMGEILIRFIMPQQLIVSNPEIWTAADAIGWRHKKNAATVINTGEGLVHFVSDSNGYRINYLDSAFAVSNPDFSILFLGDSFIEAVQVENRQTMPQVIKRLLEQACSCVVHVDNAAVGGWDPNQYLLECRQIINSKNYDLVVVCLYTANDIVNRRIDNFTPQSISISHDFRFPRNLKWNEIVDAMLYPVNDALETTSHLFLLFKSSMSTILAKAGLTAKYFPEVFLKSEKKSSRWLTTAEICKDIQLECSKSETPVLFALISTYYQVYEEIFYEYVEGFDLNVDSVDLNQPNHLLKQTFSTKGIDLVDLLENFRRLAVNGSELYGTIDNHFSADGHQLMADSMLPVIMKMLAIPE